MGGQQFHRYALLYDVALGYAVEDAVVRHAKGGANDLCTHEGDGVWVSEDCAFSLKSIKESFLTVFDQAFHERVSFVFQDVAREITFPSAYSVKIDNGELLVESTSPFVYSAFNHSYSVPVRLAADVAAYFALHPALLSDVQKKTSCLLESLGKDLALCFSDSLYSWQVVPKGGYMHFVVEVGDIASVSDVEIRFAIDLKSLEDFSG